MDPVMMSVAWQLFKSDNFSLDDKLASYKIKVNTSDPRELLAKVTIQGQKYIVNSDNIHWHGIDGISNETLLQLVSHSSKNFDINIVPTQPGIFEINIILNPPKEPVLISENKAIPREKMENNFTLLTCLTTRSFGTLLKQKNELYTRILSFIVDQFCSKASLKTSSIKEISELVEHLTMEDILRIIEKLAKDAATNVINKEGSLNGLTNILTYIFRKHLPALFDIAQEKSIENPNIILKNFAIGHLNETHLVRLLNSLLPVLEKEPLNADILLIFIRTCIVVVDTMMLIDAEKLRRERHYEAFLNILDQFSKHDDCRVAFLATYGKQCLHEIGNDESMASAFFRRSFFVFKGLAKIGENITLTQPWKILGAINSIDDFKRAFSHLPVKFEWFKKLRVLQGIFLYQKNSKSLEEFIDCINTYPQEIKKALKDIKLEFSFFVEGLVVLLHQILDSYPDDPLMVKSAITLLKKIRQDNLPVHEETDQQIFNVNKAKLAKIYVKIMGKVKSQELDEFKVKQAKYAETIVNQIDAILLEKRVPDSENELLKQAVKAIAPWVDGIKEMQKCVEEDPQVTDEWEFAIDLNGKNSDIDPNRITLENKLQELLQDEMNKVVLVLGNSGSGKSLFSKLHILKDLDTFDPTKPISLYVSMNTLQKPDVSLMDEVLHKFGMNTKEQINFLKSKRIYLFIDSYDEWFIKGRKENNRLINLYEENHLSQEWPHLQLIVMCRRDFLQNQDHLFFLPSVGSCKKVYISPFEKNDIKTYLPKYIAVRTKRDPHRICPPLLWKDPELYLRHIKKLGLWDVISNPFNLRVMADTLPSIVERNTEIGSHDQSRIESGQLIKVQKEDLFDEFICQRYLEEFRRQLQHGAPVKTMKEYLEFARLLTKNMQVCQVRSVGLDDRELLEANAKEFIESQKTKLEAIQVLEQKMNDDSVQSHAEPDRKALKDNISHALEAPNALWKQLFDSDPLTISLRRACLLIKRDGRIEFLHDSIYQHFKAIDEIPEDQVRLLKRIVELEAKIFGNLNDL